MAADTGTFEYFRAGVAYSALPGTYQPDMGQTRGPGGGGSPPSVVVPAAFVYFGLRSLTGYGA